MAINFYGLSNESRFSEDVRQCSQSMPARNATGTNHDFHLFTNINILTKFGKKSPTSISGWMNCEPLGIFCNSMSVLSDTDFIEKRQIRLLFSIEKCNYAIQKDRIRHRGVPEIRLKQNPHHRRCEADWKILHNKGNWPKTVQKLYRNQFR